MARFCSECGTQMKDGAAFCSECGSKVAGRDPATPSQPARPTQPAQPAATAVPLAQPAQSEATPTSTPAPPAADRLKSSFKAALTPEQVKQAIAKTLIVWVGLLVLITVITWLITKLASPQLDAEKPSQLAFFGFEVLGRLLGESINVALGVPSPLAAGSISLLMGLGGEAVLSDNDGYSNTVKLILLVVPVLASTGLLIAHKKVAQQMSTSAANWQGIVVGLASLPVVVLAFVLGRGTIDEYQRQMTVIVPLIAAFVIGWLSGGGHRILAAKMVGGFSQELKLALQSVLDFAKAMLPVALIISAGILVFQGLAIGSKVSESGPAFIIGVALGLLLALPNNLVIALFALAGTSIEDSEIRDGDTEFASVSLPLWVVGLFALIVIIGILARNGKGTAKSSTQAWWVHALVFACVGWVLAFLTTVTSNSQNSTGKSSDYSFGFNIFEAGARTAVLGFAIGLAMHPAVASKLAGLGAITWGVVRPLSTPCMAIGDFFQSKLGFNRDSHLLADTDPQSAFRAQPGWIYGSVLALAGIAVVAFIAMPVGSALFKGETASDKVDRIAGSINSGDANAFKQLLDNPYGGNIASSNGVKNTTAVLDEKNADSESEEESATITWTEGERKGLAKITLDPDKRTPANKVVLPTFDQPGWGLKESWSADLDESEGGLPTLRAVGANKKEEANLGAVTINANGVDGETVRTMPGAVPVSVTRPIDSRFDYTAVKPNVSAVSGDTNIPVKVTVPESIAKQAIDLQMAKLNACKKNNSGYDCPIADFCKWVVAPTPNAFVAGADSPNTLELYIRSGKTIRYKKNEFLRSGCSDDTQTLRYNHDSSTTDPYPPQFTVNSDGTVQ